MTAARVAAARAEIARLRTLAEAATAGTWRTGRTPEVLGVDTGIVDEWALDAADADHIAAWDPARVLRVLNAAEKALDRHQPWAHADGWEFCARCGAPSWPCTEAAAVLDIYVPETT